jgi:phosphoglycolate phosphatase
MNGIKTILWDWNGTLLDDTEICRQIVNGLLEKRNLPKLSIQKYQDIFTFPVKDYYEKAGFDFSKEEFKVPADEFIQAYHQKIDSAKLHDQTEQTLQFFKQKKHLQFIISAMEHNTLIQSIKDRNIFDYFEHISGINNHYAHSKTENAIRLIADHKLNPSEVCLIGDTIHDFEVAEVIECKCILVSNGHQSKDRLKTAGCPVLNSLAEIKNLF